MLKKFIIALILIGGISNVAWYAASRIYQKQVPPDAATSREYIINYINRMKIDVNLKVMEETYIDANGFKIHLTVFPIGKKAPTLVFIPGTSVYAQFYIEFMYDMYRQGFNVVGFDPRGHGQSSGARGDYAINEIVDDTLAVVKYARDRFGGNVALAGSSQGGMVAFYAAARDDSIAAAVCHNIADLNGRDNLVLSQLRPPHFMIPIGEFMMGLYQSYSIPISLYLDLKIEKMKDGTDMVTFSEKDPLVIGWITLKAMRSLLRTDLRKPVEKIKVPIMLVHSDQDNIFPRQYVEGIYTRLTCKKKYLLFKNTAHLVMTNNVAGIVPPVSAWLKEIMR